MIKYIKWIFSDDKQNPQPQTEIQESPEDYKKRLINHWQSLMIEISENRYEGGTPNRPAFRGFTPSEKINYCGKMINIIKNGKANK